MARFLKKTGAFTLIELLIVSLILSVVFLGAGAVYISALKFLKNMQTYYSGQSGASQVDVLIALEQITRQLGLANEAIIDPTGQQLEFRWDYQLNTFVPNHTPSDLTDDTWMKFAIIGGNLYWKNETTEGQDVTSSDQQLVQGLVLQPGSEFALANPSGQGIATVVDIVFISQVGNPAVDQQIQTGVLVGAWPKN